MKNLEILSNILQNGSGFVQIELVTDICKAAAACGITLYGGMLDIENGAQVLYM